MGKQMGSEKLGSFYTGKRAKSGVSGAVSGTLSMTICSGFGSGVYSSVLPQNQTT